MARKTLGENQPYLTEIKDFMPYLLLGAAWKSKIS
jgi:hypothetical protein